MLCKSSILRYDNGLKKVLFLNCLLPQMMPSADCFKSAETFWSLSEKNFHNPVPNSCRFGHNSNKARKNKQQLIEISLRGDLGNCPTISLFLTFFFSLLLS